MSQFLDEDFWNLVVGETNRKSDQFFAIHKNFSKRSIFSSWNKTNSQEMKKFIDSIFLQGLVKKPRWPQFWSFAALMDRDWYQLLMKFFHGIVTIRQSLRKQSPTRPSFQDPSTGGAFFNNVQPTSHTLAGHLY